MTGVLIDETWQWHDSMKKTVEQQVEKGLGKWGNDLAIRDLGHAIDSMVRVLNIRVIDQRFPAKPATDAQRIQFGMVMASLNVAARTLYEIDEAQQDSD